MITAESLQELALQEPSYEFVEPEADAPKVSPIKQQIAKIQETASTFTLYDVYKALGQIDKAIDDKRAEIEGHLKTKALFEAELALIEKALGVSDLERQYQVEVAAEIAAAEALKTPGAAETDACTTDEQDS